MDALGDDNFWTWVASGTGAVRTDGAWPCTSRTSGDQARIGDKALQGKSRKFALERQRNGAPSISLLSVAGVISTGAAPLFRARLCRA